MSKGGASEAGRSAFGAPARISGQTIIDELIRLAKAKGDVWFATHADVVRFARNHGLIENAGS